MSLMQLLVNFNIAFAINRDDGILTIEETARFKPDYLVNALTDKDMAFWNDNKDEFGIAWKIFNFNGDQLMDLQLFTKDRKQILYAVP